MKEYSNEEQLKEEALVFPPILKIDVTEEIIGRIKSLLAEGKLKPGSKLPPERELAQMLNVGRPAIRQALKALAALGIIDSRVGQGTFVNESTEQLLAVPMDFMMLLNPITIRELFEVRKALDVELAGLAVDRATEEDIARIEVILKAQQENLTDAEAFLNLDLEFHRAIADAARNVLFMAILGNLSRLMVESRRELLRTEHDVSLSLEDHQRIFKAIVERNRSGACEAMLRHIERVYRHWESTQRDLPNENHS